MIGELRDLYGLKRGELGKIQREKGTNGFGNVNQSGEGFTDFMTHSKIAKESMIKGKQSLHRKG
jgi:hypothetical protein